MENTYYINGLKLEADEVSGMASFGRTRIFTGVVDTREVGIRTEEGVETGTEAG